MGLDDMLKQQVRQHAPELKQKLVDEFSELTHKDMEEAGDDPDEIVDRIQKKTGQATRASRAACQSPRAESELARTSGVLRAGALATIRRPGGFSLSPGCA
jgi:hypothetical protein